MMALAANRVEFILFTDFQCPFCAQFAQSFRELQSNGVPSLEKLLEYVESKLAVTEKSEVRRP